MVCCVELETLESQLAVMEEQVSRYKKAAQLWKARYKQERTARYSMDAVWMYVLRPIACRLAAEQRVAGLQQLVDDTFQQFALEDSEDDSFEEQSSTSDSGTPPHRTEPNTIPLPAPPFL